MKHLLILLLCALLAVTFLAGCAQSAPAPASAPAAPTAPAPAAPSPPAANFAPGLSPGPAPPHDSAFPLPILTPPSMLDGRKMIYTVSMRLQTTEFWSGARHLLNTVSGMGGYVEFANIIGHDIRRSHFEREASYNFRIPSEQLPEFLVFIENNYNVMSLRQETQDATTQYQQADSRLIDLYEQQSRLLEDLAAPGLRIQDRIALERRLEDVQNNIVGLGGSISSIDHSVIYSTVHVTLHEVYEDSIWVQQPDPTFRERLVKALQNSANVFLIICEGLLFFILSLIPIILGLAIFAAIVLLVILLVRKICAKLRPRKTKAAPQNNLPNGEADSANYKE